MDSKVDHLLPIDDPCTFEVQSWQSYVETRGVSEDGWCEKSCVFRFKTTHHMTLSFLVEFPGWQKAASQMLKLSAKGVTVRSSLKPGTAKIEITLSPGGQKVCVFASNVFNMPSPDSRKCSFRIKELNFQAMSE